jgi:hypothetical protein
MNLWPLCAFIWFNNIEKMLLQMTSGFLQLESALLVLLNYRNFFSEVFGFGPRVKFSIFLQPNPWRPIFFAKEPPIHKLPSD